MSRTTRAEQFENEKERHCTKRRPFSFGLLFRRDSSTNKKAVRQSLQRGPLNGRSLRFPSLALCVLLHTADRSSRKKSTAELLGGKDDGVDEKCTLSSRFELVCRYLQITTGLMQTMSLKHVHHTNETVRFSSTRWAGILKAG